MTSVEATRRILEEQLRLVLEQKVLLESHLADLNSLPRSSVAAPLKRSAPMTAAVKAQPAKRQRVGDEKTRRLEAVWQQVSTVLKALMKQRDATTFSQPVDAIKLGVPDYYKIIKKPMDLGTIKNKLEHHPERGKPRQYTTPYEVRDDIRQVWENCRLYNPVGTPVRGMGDRLSETWEKKWYQSGVEARWEGLMRELKEEEWGPALVAQRMKEMNGELQQLVSRAAPEKSVRPLAETGPRPLTFEEKRRLSVALGSLPGEKLARVLEIIAESSPALAGAGDSGEVELDIDQLDDRTLFQLDQYTTQVLAMLDKKDGGQPLNGLKSAVQQKTRPQAPLAGKSAPQAAPAAAPAAAAAAPAASSSSSSDSDSSSSSSDSESAGEVGSKQDGATSGPANKGGNTADQSAFVSSTHPPAGGIYQPKHNKNVQLENATAWGALASAPEGDAKAAAADDDAGGATGAADGSGEAAEPDALWTEFQSREQELRKREEVKKAQEQRLQAEKAAEIEAARAETERQRALAAAEVEAEKKAAAEAAAQKAEELEAKRRAELAELKKLQAETGDLVDQQDVMKQFERDGGQAGGALGISVKADDDDSDDEEEEDDSEDDDEEGQLT